MGEETSRSSITWSEWIAPFEDPLKTQSDAQKGSLRHDLRAPPQLSDLRIQSNRSIPIVEQGELSCANAHYAFNDASSRYLVDQTNAMKGPSLPLTLGSALGRALCLNPQVRSSWAGIQKASSELGLTRSSFWPQASLGVMRQHSRTGGTNIQGGSSIRATSESFTISWRVFDFGARDARERAAQAQLRAALAGQNQSVREISWAVMEAYVQAQALQAQLKRQNEISELGKSILSSSERRYAQGASARNAFLQAHATLERNRFEIEKTRSELLIAEQKLRTLSGLAPLQSVDLDPIPDEVAEMVAKGPLNRNELSSPNAVGHQSRDFVSVDKWRLDEWLRSAREISPAVVAAAAKLDAAAATVEAVASDAMPKLDVNYSYYRNGRPTQSLSSSRSNERTAGITLTIPLFEGFSSTYRIQNAEASRQAANIELDAASMQSDQELLDAYTQAQAGIGMLNAALKLYEITQQLAQSNEKLFQAGVLDAIEVSRGLLDLQNANLELTKAQAQWLRAKLHLWLIST
ncbi:TolC family protein [Comamonas sp. MYb21]